ncbi:hypothetical protein ACROYT_G030823 [Oculina patagonica]
MASNGKPDLLEKVKREGFEVDFDPPGNGMCFYAAAGHQLGMNAIAVQRLLFNYLHHHRYEDNGDDRLDFLCSVDIGGKKVPDSWGKALELLKHNYANAMVIRAIPEILHYKVVIVTVHGSSPGEYVKVFEPKKGPSIGTLYFGHTGDHYVALKPLTTKQSDDNQASRVSAQTLDQDSSEDVTYESDQDSDVVIISPRKGNINKEKYDDNHVPLKASPTLYQLDSDCEIISPKKPESKNNKTKAKRRAPLVMDWWEDEETYQPGISVFKGIKLDPVDVTMEWGDLKRPLNHSDDEGENFKASKKQKIKSDVVDGDIDVVDDKGNTRATKKQKKIGPDLWADVDVEEVDKVPDDINGLKAYKVNLSTASEKSSDNSAVKDGRPWKKDSQTEWKAYGKIRYSDCKGSYTCTNPKCEFKMEFGVVNCTQFDKKKKSCAVCGSKGKHVPCFARRYVFRKKQSVFVYHCGDHTCPSKPVISKPVEDVRRTVAENPTLTPSQIQSNIILSMMKQRRGWDSIEKAATETLDKKWITNEKQKTRKENEPHGHNFEAVAHFKQFADSRDPYYVYKMNDRRGNPERPSFVFKTSKLKASFALNMDETIGHTLSKEFCFFDGKVKRCDGFVSLTASVYHPILRKLVSLATMECETEDACNVELFWNCFNEVLKKEKKDKNYVFNPRGWITDMAGSNMEGIKRVFGPKALNKLKTCEFHFKECRNRQARKLNDDARRNFKDLCNALLEAVSPMAYEKSKEDLENFVAESKERKYLQSWIEWWHKRRNYIFRAFVQFESAPKMNLAELIHASWVKRDRMNMSLLDAAYADSRDCIQLEAAYKAFQDGTGKGGTGPSLQEKQNKATRDQIRRAKQLGEDLCREDFCDEDHRSAYQDQDAPGTPNPYDRHNASVSQKTKSSGTREGRYRPIRSKTFIDRLQMAKREKQELKIKSMDSFTALQRSYTVVNINKNSTYKVEVGKSPCCNCADFEKNSGKELCKHIIWTLLNVCRLPENSDLLHQLFLADDEALSVVGNSFTVIPQNLMFKKGTNKTRREIIQELISNDPRNNNQQIWTLEEKKKKRGPAPRCRTCRAIQEENEATVTVRGLYVPYEQNFVTETVFYFCPKKQCVNKVPHWTNLKPPVNIKADSSINGAKIATLKADGLPL